MPVYLWFVVIAGRLQGTETLRSRFDKVRYGRSVYELCAQRLMSAIHGAR